MREWQSRSMKNRDTGVTIHTFVNAWKAWQHDMKAPKHIDNWLGMWLLKPSPRRGKGLQPSQHIKVNREFLEMLGSIFFQVCIGWGRGQHIAQQAKPSTHKMCVSLLLGRSCPDFYIFQPCQFPAGFPVPKNSECEDKDRWNAWQRHNHTRLPTLRHNPACCLEITTTLRSRCDVSILLAADTKQSRLFIGMGAFHSSSLQIGQSHTATTQAEQ